jgi:outer membrane protein assembly factor BamA/autotransporter translocation and assembly factor TamB
VVNARRRWVAAGAAIATLVIVAIAALHSPPVRSRLLAIITARLVQNGVVARVDGLDYNLFTRTVHLSGVTLATPSAAATPFFSANDVRATFPLRTFFGHLEIQSLELESPRVTLLRDRDGRTNWPAGSNEPAKPLSLAIGRARVGNLAFAWTDEQAKTRVNAGISLDLTSDGGDVAGPLTMTGPTSVRVGDRETAATALDGRLSWNDRDLSLHALALRAPEGTLHADGTIASLLADPRIDLTIVSDVDVAAASRWVTPERPIAGTAHAEARLAGPMAKPDIDLTALHASIAGGSITAKGRVSIDGPGSVRAEWKRVDVPSLVDIALGPSTRWSPAARLDGSLTAQWTTPDLDHVQVTADSRASGDAAGATRVELRGRQFTLAIDDLAALGARATAAIDGTLNTADFSQSTIRGSVDVKAEDAAKLTRALVQAGLIQSAPAIRGTTSAAFTVGGTFAAPSLDGSLNGAVQYESLPQTSFSARASISRDEANLREIDARLADSSVRGAVRWTSASNNIDGMLTGSLPLKTLHEVAAAIPRTLPLDGSVDFSAALSGSLAAPRIAVHAAGNGLDVAGERIDRLTADARISGPEVAVDTLLLELGTGRVDGSATIHLGRETYAARVNATNVPVRPLAGIADAGELPVSGTVSGTFEGTGTFQRLGGRGHLSLADARWRDADFGRLDTDFTLAGREVSFSVDGADLALKASGSVSLDPNGALSVRGRWEPTDLAAIARRLTIEAPFSTPGAASLGFEVTAARDRLSDARGFVTVDRLDVAVADQPIRLARPGRIESDGRTVRVDEVVLATGSSTLTIAGALGDSAPAPLTLTLDGSVGDFAFVRDLVQPRAPDTAERPLPAGSVHARITAEGSLERPRLAASFQIAGGSVPVTDRASVTGIEIGATYADGVLVVDRAAAAFEGATLAASARVPSRVFLDQVPEAFRRFLTAADGPATLSAQLHSITPSIVAPFVDAATLEQIGLNADASLNLESDRAALDRVRGDITLGRAEVSLAGVSFDQQQTTRLVVGDGRVTVDTWDWGHDDNRVVLRGSATIAGDPTLDLVANAALDLRLLNVLTPAARITGRADAEVRLGGTAAAPTAGGYVTFSDGEARVADPRVIVGDITGTITLAGDTMTFHRLSATVNGGDAEVAGSIRHRSFTPIDGNLTFRTTSSSFDLQGLRADADAALDWTIDSSGPALSGTVTLLRSAYREPLSLTGGLLSALRSSTSTATPAAPSLLEQTRLDVRLVTQDDLLIDNNLARATARTDLRLVGTPARPSILGRLTVVEGGTLFFGGNRYRLPDDGTIDFANPNRIEPDLDVRAVTRVQGEEIRLEITGTPSTLQTTPSSDNPQWTQSDLVSLLLIGKTAQDADANAAAADQLLGVLTAGLLGTAGRAVGLDTVRLEHGSPDVRYDAGLVASDTNPGQRLTFGKQIGKFEVVFSQSLQESGGMTWIVNWTPRGGVGLRAVSLDDGDRLYDFTHNITFGGPKRAATAAPARPSVRVTDVAISGAGSDEPQLRERLKLKAGNRFSFFEWQDDRERLERFYHESQRFEARVNARRLVDPNDATRVRLTYDVRPGPRTTISVDGFSPSGSTLDAMATAWTRAVVDDFLRDEVANLARADLADEGYMLPTVTARVERRADDKLLRVVINPGAHASDRKVEFSGNTHEKPERLLTVIAERGLKRAVWIDPPRVQQALDAFYRANGYLKAAVRIDPVSMSGATAIRPIHIDEGDPFVLRTVRFDGVHAMPQDEAERISGLSAGQVFTEARIEQAQLALDAQYRARGFNRVAILHQVESGADSSAVDVSIHVEEGPQQRLRDVVTTGLARTRPSLVSRALKLDVGTPVDLAAWNAARRRLYQTGAFRSVDIQREVIEPATAPADSSMPPPEEPVRATVAVQEWPPFRLRYGIELQDELATAEDARSIASVSEGGGRTFGVGAAGDLGFRNLFGRAISAGVAGRYTLDTRTGRVYGTAPSFFGWPIVSNVFVERSISDVGATAQTEATRQEKRTDFTFEQRIRPAARTEVAYSYSYERNHTIDLNPDPNNPLPFDLLVRSGRFASSVLFDRRDDLSDATRGWFHSSSLEYAPEWRSDVRFIKYFVQQKYYWRTGAVVLASYARLGLATAFEKTLIPADRFFAGGGNSVRGYEEDVLGPVDLLGDPAGGNAIVVLNQEVRFPIVKYVRGVGFFDAGRAFDKVASLSLRDLSASTGFGLRVVTPVVLVRIDYGLPFDSSVGPRNGRWFFSIGQMF